MPISTTPRSVSDATRFTPTTPHASSKAAEQPRFSSPGLRKPVPTSGSGGSSGGDGPKFYETPDQKVARLRAAHMKAKASQVSRFDKVIDGGRRFFDSAHKVTVMSLIGFTVLAGLVTVYTAVDMMTYNSKRKAEFIEAQRKMEADSLDAARLAYMTGKATAEQIELVEEVMDRERASGQAGGNTSSIFTKLPNVISKPNSSGFESAAATQKSVSEAATWPSSSGEKQQQSVEAAPTEEEKKKAGLWAWMTASLKKEEEGDEPASSQRRLGWDSLSEEDDSTGVRDSDLVRAVEDKARAAFDKEREKQRKGGPLDQIGLEGANKKEGEQGDDTKEKKKGWLW